VLVFDILFPFINVFLSTPGPLYDSSMSWESNIWKLETLLLFSHCLRALCCVWWFSL